METSQQKVEAALAALNKELDSVKKARLATIVVGAVLFLVVFFVFMSATRKVQKSFGPESLADLASYTVRQTIKEGRPVAEKAFKEHIPVFLKNLRVQVVGLVPFLRREIQRELVRVVDASFLNSSRAFSQAVRAAVERVKPVADRQGTPPPDALAALIMQEFERETEKRYSDTPTETLGAQFEQSRAMLEGLNRKLQLLAGKKKPSTRGEALELKFIRAWVGLLSQGEGVEDGKPAVTSPEGSDASAPVPPPAP